MILNLLLTILSDYIIIILLILINSIFFFNLSLYKNISDFIIRLKDTQNSYNENVYNISKIIMLIILFEISYRIVKQFLTQQINRKIRNQYDDIYIKYSANTNINNIDKGSFYIISETINTTENIIDKLLIDTPLIIVYVGYFVYNILKINYKLIFLLVISCLILMLISNYFYVKKFAIHNENIKNDKDIKIKFGDILDNKIITQSVYEKREKLKNDYNIFANIILLLRDTFPLLSRLLIIIIGISQIQSGVIKTEDLIFASMNISMTIKYIAELYSIYDEYKKNKKIIDDALF